MFAWLNHRWLGLPNNVGLLIMGSAASLVLIATEILIPNGGLFSDVHRFVEGIDFSATLLNGMLAFLLFAGLFRSTWRC